MSYSINLTNGTPLATVSDGTVDTSHTSLTLIGRDYAGYGTFLNENFVYMLENFANNTGPANPLKGQLWWDTTNNILKVWSGTSWKISTGATSAPYSSPPGDLSALGGDLWFDTTNSQLKVYSGSAWVTVGPAATPATGNTGANPALMSDTGGGTHIVIQFTINGTVYAILSKDTFTSALTGFTTIKQGLNFNTLGSTVSPLLVSTQDVNATPNTIVQRDGTGGIVVAGISASTLTASSITTATLTSGTFTGNLVGNVSANSVTTSVLSATGVNASAGYTGALLTANQPNITSLGTLTGLAVNGTTALTGSATLNGIAIATIGGSAPYSSVNAVIGNVTPYSGVFTTITTTGTITPVANGVITLGSTSNYWGTVYASGLSATGTVAATNGNFSSNVTAANTMSAAAGTFGNVAATFTVSGTTGSFTNLSAVSTVSGSTGSFTNVTASGTVSGTTGSFGATNVSGTVTAAGGAFTNVTASSTVSGSTGSFTNVTASGTVTAGTLNATNINISSSFLPTTSGINVGSSGHPFNIIYGTATQAEYADLAERFASDAAYPVGTVMELGGTAEVTQVVGELSENVFGVISTNAAYLMNGSAGSNDTHPAIALAGRVPVRVIGVINKGDRLVSAGNGLARAGLSTEITPFNIIGRAIESKVNVDEGVIEAIVRVNI